MKKLVEKNFLGQEMEFYGCKSCAISNHEITNLVGGYLYDDGFVNVTADPEVPIEGFMIVGIKPHVPNLTLLKPEERFQICEVTNSLESIMHELGYENILKFEDGFSSHWRQWLIPASDKIFYNPRIYESDEKSRTKWIEYYERFTVILLQALQEESITKEDYQLLIDLLYKTDDVDEIVEVFKNIYGTNFQKVLRNVQEYNMNFGRGKNLKNISNYAKKFATDEDKEQVLEFAGKVKRKFYEYHR
ncbi:MAG: hypothetical protein IKE63_01290 [Bacilli bacterium]|nr:hypothetical protein [Bacilli bacterium]